jgi:hypothetical protein
LTAALVGAVVRVGGIMGGSVSDDGDVNVVTLVGASSLDTFIGWKDVWMDWWLGVRLHVFLTWRPRWSGVSSTIYNDESRRHGAMGSRGPACLDGRT